MIGLINGVPADQYGTWCRHGEHVLVVDPSDTGEYPRTIPAEPWPCDQGCTLEQLEADLLAEAEEYDRSLRAEVYP